MFSCLTDCKGLDTDAEEIVTPSGGSKDTVGLLKRLAAEERRYRDEEHKQQQELERRKAEAKALRRAEEQAFRQSQEMMQKVKDTQKAYKEEQARYEQLRRERELLQHTAAAKEAEGKRLLEERERWLRKTAVVAFLKEHGFPSVNAPKKVMMKTTFPLHMAAEAGNAKMVEMLIKEGAEPDQRNSVGKTPTQLAQAAQAKRGGMDDSHEDVLRVLAGLSRARIGGA